MAEDPEEEGLELDEELTKFTWSYMKGFALGRLLYSPERFGRMRVGDFLDAMTGYTEGENERIRAVAEIVRTSTALLWNIQVDAKSKLGADELWPFPWEKKEEPGEQIPDEKIKDFDERQKKYLTDNFPG